MITMNEIRYRGLMKAGIGFLVALVALILARLQILGGQTTVMIGGGAVVGWIFFAVGLFQLISGRDDDHGGIGWLGMIFVVVVGLVGSVAGFLAAFHH